MHWVVRDSLVIDAVRFVQCHFISSSCISIAAGGCAEATEMPTPAAWAWGARQLWSRRVKLTRDSLKLPFA